MTGIKAIIFDLGKVVFDLSFDRVYQYWAVASGQHSGKIKQGFAFDRMLEKLETNEISSTRFRKYVSEQLGFQLSNEVFDKGWCNLYLDPYEGINELLVNLKRDYRLVALTNTNFIHMKVWNGKYADTLRHFEKIFSSCEIGARKPDARAYKIVLEYLGLEPSETLFLDDNAEHVHSAIHIGIPAITVFSFGQMNTELISLLKRHE